MYDSTLHAKTLARQIRKSDFQPGLLQIAVQQRSAVIDKAVSLANSGFSSVSVRRGHIAGKPVYQQSSLPEALVTRHISQSIRRITSVKQSDRQAIIKCIRAFASEGTTFNIFKFDIKSFYESIDPFSLVADLRNDAAFSRQSVDVLHTFFSALQSQGITGLPRGFELSATLAEYAMRMFDHRMAHQKGVRFYSRFVDDILVIASPKIAFDDVRDAGLGWLPGGLSFRNTKSKPYEFTRSSAGSPELEHEFVFLGYCIKVSRIFRHEDCLQRRVTLDIAPSKVKKIKRRIALALLEFKNGGPFSDLQDRIKILTSNYTFYENRTGAKRLAGIRYSYSLVNGHESESLANLDRFLYNALYSLNPKNRLRPSLTTSQKRVLFGYSFKTGFLENRFYSFDQNDLHRITSCWSHA